MCFMENIFDNKSWQLTFSNKASKQVRELPKPIQVNYPSPKGNGLVTAGSDSDF